MIVAITGGTGFIGERLVLRHLDRGDQVRLLSRREHQKGKFPPDAITVFQGDLTKEYKNLSAFVDGVDVLYHCAGEMRVPGCMYAVHVEGTRKLIDAAFGRIGHWVQLSSVGAYGPRPNGAITEETPENPASIYEKTKTESDRLVIEATQRGAFTYTILRPSNVFGPTMTNRSLFQLVSTINRGIFFFIGTPGAVANYIHVDNVVDALLRSGRVAEAKDKVYNLSDHRTIEEFVAIIANALCISTPKLRLSETMVRLVARAFSKLPGFPLTEPRVNALVNRAIYSSDKIQNELRYAHVVSMEDGLREFVKVWKHSTN